MTHPRLRHIFLFLAVLTGVLFALPVGAQTVDEEATKNEDVDRLAPDFVHAYVVIAEPYKVLYSSYGHSALRLTCPTYGLDYIFTCEGEAAEDNITRFLLGKLKMGVYALKTDVFLKDYERQGRKVTQYELNLPPEVKQRLWQQMDERKAAAPTPYDFIENGCTHLVLCWIEEALGYTAIEYTAWPETFSHTRKAIAGKALKDFPWNHLIIGTMVDGRLNEDCSNAEKVIIPADLVYVLKHAKVNGQPIIKGEQEILKSRNVYADSSFMTPLMIASVILLTTIVLLIAGRRYPTKAVLAVNKIWTIIVLAIVCGIGLFLLYLVVGTSLAGTEWNWLLVTINPLPALLWRWRESWAKPWMVICVAWCIAAVTLPFITVDDAYLPLSLAAGMLPFLRTNHNSQ